METEVVKGCAFASLGISCLTEFCGTRIGDRNKTAVGTVGFHLKLLRRLVLSYLLFFKQLGGIAWLFGALIYPFVAGLLALWFGFNVHPLASLLPMVPPFILALMEDHRKSKTVMGEAFETSPEEWWKTMDYYVNDYNIKKKKDESSPQHG